VNARTPDRIAGGRSATGALSRPRANAGLNMDVQPPGRSPRSSICGAALSGSAAIRAAARPRRTYGVVDVVVVVVVVVVVSHDVAAVISHRRQVPQLSVSPCSPVGIVPQSTPPAGRGYSRSRRVARLPRRRTGFMQLRLHN